MKLGICGGGVVGGGVVELRRKEVSKVLVREITKKRDFPCEDLLTQSLDEVLENSDVIVEVIGGDVGGEIILRALKMKKPVVSANKQFIAKNLSLIEKTAELNDVPFLYEAAVCGGIPIISCLLDNFENDVIYSIFGILNGTSNFLCSEMEKGETFEKSLELARKLGFAEQDPTNDVDGFDARAKLIILARICFGFVIEMESVFCQSMRNLIPKDFEEAEKMNRSIRYVCFCDENSCFCSPCFVDSKSSLARCFDCDNEITVKSRNLQETTLKGKGAGRFPTANSVVSDLGRLKVRKIFSRDVRKFEKKDLEFSFYVRGFVEPKFVEKTLDSGLFITKKIKIEKIEGLAIPIL